MSVVTTQAGLDSGTSVEAPRAIRILSIDGGGMKGVYACAYLAVLEEHFGIKLHEHFDLVAGTSTGGIIALGIGAKLSAREILQFYRDKGALIFPRRKELPKLIDRLRTGYCYANTPLKSALDSVFGDKTMGDSATMLCIPAIDANSCHPTVFKHSSAEHLDRDVHRRMSDIALATSAAPWFFPMAVIQEGDVMKSYVDGGLWANNPAMIGVVEATRHHCGEGKNFNGIELLSIGLPTSSGFKKTQTYEKGKAFVNQLLTYSMETHKLGIDYQVQFLLTRDGDRYFRVKPTNVSESDAKLIELDSATEDARSRLVVLGQNDAQRDKVKEDLRVIFARTRV